jgi:3-oxoisoapionate decarboxylase
MDRRQFLAGATLSGFALSSFTTLPGFLKGKRMGIVVHSYASRWNSKIPSTKYPGFTNAIDMLEHCANIGAGGIQVVVKDWSPDFAKKVRDRREKLGLYLEGSIALPAKPEDVSKFEQDVVNAKEAGAVILRTVASSGRRYEIFHSQEDFENAYKKALVSLQLAEPVVRKYKVKLAVENHKDWRAMDLVNIIKKISSEWVGVTLDFGNSIALMEDPMEVVNALAPYAYSTHVKDMGLDEYAEGFLLSEVPLGKGILDLKTMVATCEKYNPNVAFSLEMITRDPLEIPCLKEDYWATFDGLQAKELARTLKMVRDNKFKPSLPRVSQLSGEEKLSVEEENILACLAFSENSLGLK